MTDCLFECLREARLEKYYRNFVNGGLRHCEALLHLSMQEYPKYGVVSMEDRLKLFKLIQIVKSVQAEGLVCQHGKHIHAKYQSHIHMNMDKRNNNATKRQTNVIKITTNNGRVSYGNRRQLPQAPQNGHQSEVSNLRRSSSMRQVKQIDAPALRRSSSMRQSNDQPSRRSKSSTRVEYKPNSDSPIFHCRRHLKFTDSDLETTDEEEEETKPPPLKQEIGKDSNTLALENRQNGASKQSNVLLGKEPSESNSVQKQFPMTDHVNDQLSSVGAITAQNIFSSCTNNLGKPLNTVTEPKVRTFNLATDARPEESPDDLPNHVIKNGSQPSPYQPQSSKISNKNVVHIKSSTGAIMVEIEPKKTVYASKAGEEKCTVSSAPDTRPQISMNNSNNAHAQDIARGISGNHQHHMQSTLARNVHVPSTDIGHQSTSAFHQVRPTLHANPKSQSISHSYTSSHQNGLTNIQSSTNTVSAQQTVPVSSHQEVTMSKYVYHLQSQEHTMRPFHFKNFQPSSVIPSGQHSYFPNPTQSAIPQEQKIKEQIYHGNGYNYGVPNSVTNLLQQNKSKSPLKPAPTQNLRIRVCVRKRPLLNHEVQRGDVDIVHMESPNMVAVDECKLSVDLSKVVQKHIFKFDNTFGASSGNDVIYGTAVKPLVQCAFNKGTATCFAFGQTGSGKSHTLLGNPTVPGLYQLAANDLFSGFATCKEKTSTHLHLWVSYYEIYCSQLFDLLNKRKKLHVRENSRGKVCIAGLMETEVHNVKGLVEVVQYGNAVRSTGVSGANPQSSRSHAILQLEVRDNKDIKQGRMSFIDLAGSERATDMPDLDRQTRIEGAEINQSLLALKECIRSIDQEHRHTPYRQSKLTHILRDSFIGNSQTVMIANVAPCFSSCEHTLNTLRYADRVKELEKGNQNPSPMKPTAQSKVSKPSTPHLSSANQAASVAKNKTPSTNTRQTQVILHGQTDRPTSTTKVVPGVHASGSEAPKLSPSKDVKTITPSGITNGHVTRTVLSTNTKAKEPKDNERSEAEGNEQKIVHETVQRKEPNPLKLSNIPFAPVNVMYASTPKRGEGGVKDAIPISSPFDVSKILKDEPETPLRGHKIHSERNKSLDESPEIITAGRTAQVLERVENHPKPSFDKPNVVEDIFSSDTESSAGRNQQKENTENGNHARGSYEPKSTNDSSAIKSSHTQAKSDLFAQHNEENKIHVDTSKVNELVRQQNSALVMKNDRQSEQERTHRPLSAGRQRSRSPSWGRIAESERGRSETRGCHTERISRSPNRHNFQLSEELSQRSKSIESLRASLKYNKEQSKSTPSLDKLRDDKAEKNSADSKSDGKKQAWSPRSNHVNLRNQIKANSAANLQAKNKPESLNQKESLESLSSEGLVIKSHDEIMAEHREVLDHLDNLLDRAKAAVEIPREKKGASTNDTDKPLKSILKNSGSSNQVENIHTHDQNSNESRRSPKLNRKEHVSSHQNLNDLSGTNFMVESTETKSRHSDPMGRSSLGPDVRPKEYQNKTSVSLQKTPSSRPSSTEEFLKNLADIKLPHSRHSLSTSDNPSLSSSRGNTPGERRSSSGRSSAARTPSSSIITQVGNGFKTPAATSNMIGYVDGNDVVVITNDGTAFDGSPLPVGGYVPPAAPRKTHAAVNRSVNDIGFKAELERMERCDSQNSDLGSVKNNRSWHDILSQSDDDGSINDKKVRISHPASRDGSLEMMYQNDGVKQIATIRDASTVVIETQFEHQATGGRSTLDSGIGSHRDQSDPEGTERRTSSRGSHCSLDLHHLDHDTADDGISLSTDNTQRSSIVPQHVLGDNGMKLANKNMQSNRSVINEKGDEKAIRFRSSKSMPKRHLSPEEDDVYIPPLKLNFDEEDDDALEESYCQTIEREKRRELEQRAAKKRLDVHEDSAFRSVRQHPMHNDHKHIYAPHLKTSDNSVAPLVANHAPPVSNENNTSAHRSNQEKTSTSISLKNPSSHVSLSKKENGVNFSPIESFPITTKAPNKSNMMGDPTLASSSDFAMTGNQTNNTTGLRLCDAQAGVHHLPLEQQLMLSHEEQLQQMTALCKQEMKLLMAIKTSNQDFSTYVRGLEEILSDKGRCILSLKAKIDDYLKTADQSKK